MRCSTRKRGKGLRTVRTSHLHSSIAGTQLAASGALIYCARMLVQRHWLPRSGVQCVAAGSRSRCVTMAAQLDKLLHGDVFFLDAFALRQWDDPAYGGTRIAYDKAAFVARVHELFKESGGALADGYAPFCKHVFVPNFVGAKVGALEITDANRHL